MGFQSLKDWLFQTLLEFCSWVLTQSSTDYKMKPCSRMVSLVPEVLSKTDMRAELLPSLWRMALSFWWPFPIQGPPRLASLKQKYFYHSYYLGIYKHFKNPVLWIGTKINYIFHIINNSITQGKTQRHWILPSVGFSLSLSGQCPAATSRALLALGRGRKEEHPLLLWTLRLSCFCCLILLPVYSR